MRRSVTISMPWEMHEQLVRRVSKTRYATVSEYVRELIRRDDRSARERLEKRAAEDAAGVGPDESPFIVMTANRMMAEVLAERQKRRARS